jgi:hypothetical protein
VNQVVDLRILLSGPTEGSDLRKISLPVIIDTGRQIASQGKQEWDQQKKQNFPWTSHSFLPSLATSVKKPILGLAG